MVILSSSSAATLSLNHIGATSSFELIHIETTGMLCLCYRTLEGNSTIEKENNHIFNLLD